MLPSTRSTELTAGKLGTGRTAANYLEEGGGELHCLFDEIAELAAQLGLALGIVPGLQEENREVFQDGGVELVAYR